MKHYYVFVCNIGQGKFDIRATEDPKRIKLDARNVKTYIAFTKAEALREYTTEERASMVIESRKNGKSDLLRAIAQNRGMKCIDLRMPPLNDEIKDGFNVRPL